MKQNRRNKFNNAAISALAAAILSACGGGGGGCCGTGGGNNGGNTGDLSKLGFTAPNIVPSLPTLVGQGYIVAMNTGDETLNNLVYTVTEPIGGGGKISVDQTSAANCRIIPAHGECIFKVNVPAGTIAGSFVMNGNQDGGSTLNRLLRSVLKVDVTPSTVIGIEQTPYTTVAGVDGIPIYYYSVVIAGTPYVIVTGAVTSSNAGSFNDIVLVDSNNNVLPNQQAISGNLGAGLTNLSQGSTFAILLPAPGGANANQVIKIQSQEVSPTGTVSNVQTGTVNYNLSTTSNEGIVNLFPEAVYLTADNPEQIITFYNNGDAQAQLEKLIASNPNVEVEFTPSAIGGNGKSTATLKLKDTSVAANSGSIALTYNNSKSETTTTGKVDENVYPTPSPSPTPTPTPTPTPPPTPGPPPPPPPPTAGLTTTFTPNNFDVTTANTTAVRTITLKNTGSTDETGMQFTFSPSSGFAVTATPTPSPTPACTLDGSGKVTTTLIPNGECTVTVTYTSPNTTAGSHTATMGIAYTYNNGTAATTSPQTVNTDVAQSSANLASTASTSTSFGNVLDDNTATSTLYFKLTNSGEVTATGLTFSNSNSSLFTTTVSGAPAPACDISGSGTLPAGECYYGIQFGPIPLSTTAGVQNNTTTINYSWASGGATGTPSATQSTSGTVQTATSAAIALTGPTASGFANNSGPAPYQIQENSTGTLTYTYTNTGSQAANGFYVSNTTLPGGWTRTGGNCASTSGAATTLGNAGGTCTVVFSINSNTVAANNFNQDVMTANWTDQAHPSGTTQAAPSSSTDVNVYQTPAVTAVMSSSSTGIPVITSPTENTDFYVVYTLTGGYSGQSFEYGVTLGGTPGSPAMSVYSPTTCTITSPATSCSIKIASGGAATNQSITYTPQGGAVAPTPTGSGNFDVTAPSWTKVSGANIPNALSAFSVVVNSGDIYTCGQGTFSAGPPKGGVLKYDGTSWTVVGGEISAMSVARSFVLDGSDIYAGGVFNASSGPAVVTKYDGSSWATVANPSQSSIANSKALNSMVLKGSTLYAGGVTDADVGVVWTTTTSGATSWGFACNSTISGSSVVRSIVVDSSNNIYAGGKTSTTGTVWMCNGTSWTATNTISNATDIQSIILDSSDNLYAAGTTSSGGAVWKYNGSVWSLVGGAVISDSTQIRAITIDASANLYAAGAVSGGAGAVWKYDNATSTWSQLSTSFSSTVLNGITLDSSGTIYSSGQISGSSAAVWAY